MELFRLTNFRSTIVALLAVTASSLAAAPQPSEAVQTIDLAPQQVELVTHAVELFDDAGLPLPPVVVGLGDGLPGCEGTHLAFHRRHEDRSEIFLCYPQIAGRELRVLAHELAHAWASIGLTDERRDDFQALRGWEHWRNYDVVEWGQNGTEQAAEIVKWAVTDIAVPVFVEHQSCAELRDGYVALTGAEPPQGHTDLCDPEPAGPGQPQFLSAWSN